MRHGRKFATIVVMFLLALVPIAAAIPDTPHVPLAITQPVASLVVTPDHHTGRTLPESGLLLVVGGSLMALAAVVRRSTGA